jgi:hypothetical protein
MYQFRCGGAAVVITMLISGAVAILLLVLYCVSRNSDRNSPGCGARSTPLEESGRPHATYLPVIRQAMASSDFEFLASCASNTLVRRTLHERQRIAMLYLIDLRSDFEKLVDLARVIAVLAPEVGGSHEFERVRWKLRFSWHYRLVTLGLYSGPFFAVQVSRLSQIVGELAERMETAMKELGERAAVAAELASSLDRRRLDLA